MENGRSRGLAVRWGLGRGLARGGRAEMMLALAIVCGFISGIMGIGCASGPAPGPSLPALRNSEEVGEAVLVAWKSGNVDAVRPRFGAELARTLPAAEPRATVAKLTAERGELQSWRLRASATESGKERLSYELGFARGAGRAVVVVDKRELSIAELSFEAAETAAAPGATRAATTAAGIKISAESVRVGQWPFHLGGVVTAPAHQGSFPAVVLVADQGPRDKDATRGASKPFRDLAEGLAERGIVALRYDNRAYAYGGKVEAPRARLEEEIVDDALKALAVLRARKDVKPDAIFLAGHGVGALLAPEIAKRDGHVAGVVLLAPPARAAALSAADVERTLSKEGMKSLGRPVLVLQGTRDTEVSQQDFRRWQASLTGLAGSSAMLLPGLDHLLLADHADPDARRVAPSALVRISAFIKGVVATGVVATGR